jgi:4-hydroxy-tetrahydrodipicolinate reductase
MARFQPLRNRQLQCRNLARGIAPRARLVHPEPMAGSAIKVGVLGAGGRMGRAIISALAGDTRLELAGAVERAGHDAIGQPLGPPFPKTLTLGSNMVPLALASDVLVDFTTPEALQATLDAASEGKAAVVIGTTGLGPDHHAMIDAAARSIPVLQAANTSLGVTLLAYLVEEAAKALGPDWDIEIAELHHRDKRDAPSGTALALGEAAARGRKVALDAVSARGRDGVGDARQRGDIGFASLRGGSAAGDHDVLFAGDGERLTLSHHAENRAIFARGALRAAAWLAGKPPGRYQMDDVLGLAR